MINPFTTPIRVFLGVLGGVVAIALVVVSYRAYDNWQSGKRQKALAAAGVQGDSATTNINAGALLSAKADTQYVPYAVYRNSPNVRGNPVANELGNRADPLIKTLRAAIQEDTSAIRHLQSQVKDLQDAGPPLGPRAVPYLDVGYVASNRQRAVLVGRLGLDYRLLPHVWAKVEGGYQPPPSSDLKQTPEFRLIVAAHVTFR